MRSLLPAARGLLHRSADTWPKSILTNIFYSLWYNNGGTHATYRGIGLRKPPSDLWVYQEILNDIRPDVLIETGTLYGGSALFFAHQFDLLGHGEVISIDLDPKPGLPEHGRITYVKASSTALETIAMVRARVKDAATVMVILDSDHTRDHVLAELEAYAEFVTPGSYLVVEDTLVNGHPVWADHGPGPMEALDTFLADRSDFSSDRSCERFLLTQNPRGFLRRAS